MQTAFRFIAFASISMGFGISQVNAQELQGTNSPPLDIYDSNPGPYFAFPDRNGDLPPDQLEFIGQAVASWSGSNLQAFSICFSQATDEQMDWRLVKVALRNVSVALKNAGAQIVVVPVSELCNKRVFGSAVDRSHVEITGVVRAL